MAETKTARVMQLRKKSGAGITDAKKALATSNGDIDRAMGCPREKGIAKTAEKSDRAAAEGLADIAVDDNTAATVGLNPETDFAATSEPLKDLLKKVTKLVSENKPANVERALEIKTENSTLSDDIISTT